MPRPGWCEWFGHRWFSEPAIDLDCHRELAAGFKPTYQVTRPVPTVAGPGSPSQRDPIYKFAEGEPCRERASDDQGRQAYAQHIGAPWVGFEQNSLMSQRRNWHPVKYVMAVGLD